MKSLLRWVLVALVPATILGCHIDRLLQSSGSNHGPPADTAPPPITGSLTVTTATTGSGLPSGYTVSLDGGSGQAIGVNGTLTLSGLMAETHTVALIGVPSNCSVGGATSETVTVTPGASTTASFAVSCQGPPPPSNQAPVVNAGGNQSTVAAVLYQLDASFTDADNNGPWTYSVNWGDGSSSTGTLSAEGAVGPTHSYALPGSYQISVTVTDHDGASGSDGKTLTVTI